jgi:hypothetical protein
MLGNQGGHEPGTHIVWVNMVGFKVHSFYYKHSLLEIHVQKNKLN